MIRYIATLLCVLTLSLSAQSFEGFIRYQFSFPTQTQKKDTAAVVLPDDIQKVLLEKMNDPQMQEMLAQNPALKTQLETLMSGKPFRIEDMLPKELAVRAKDGNVNTQVDSGKISETIFIKATQQRSEIYRTRKTYRNNPINLDTANIKEKRNKAVKTGKTETILGYKCEQYSVKHKGEKQLIWATTDIKKQGIAELNKELTGHPALQGISSIDGLILKLELESPEINVTMTATEVKIEPQDASLFIIPADFTEEPILPNWTPQKK